MPSRAKARSSGKFVAASTSSSQPVHRTGNHTGKRLLALRCAGIALEEEPFGLSQFGATASDHMAAKLIGRDRSADPGELVIWRRSTSSTIATSRSSLRAEVVQQHSMTCADRGGYIAQGAVADAAGGEFLDQRVQ